MDEKRELPRDLLAEKSLIGCIIVDGRVFDEIIDFSLEKSDFYNHQYGLIFEGLKDLSEENKPIDYVTLSSKLDESGHLEAIGGNPTLLGIIEEESSIANAAFYAKAVKEKSTLRKIIKTANQVSEEGLHYNGKIEDYIQGVEARFFNLAQNTRTEGMKKLNSCLKENLKELEDSSRKAGEISGLSTGYPKLDSLLLGMQPGQLIVLAARPAMGKTSLAMNIAVNTSETTGLPVAVFSLEMLASELSMRLLTGKAKVDSRRIRKKEFLDNDLRNIGMAIKELSSLPIFINDATVTVLDIKSQCRRIKADHGLGLIIVDYLQLLKSHSNNPSREQQISEMSRGLKELAKELECPVITLSQLNRGVESRPEKRPNVSDLRESGAIEQDADVVMMVYRDEVYRPDTKDKGIAEIIVGKNRSGETGTVKLAWVGSYTSFENLAFEHQEF
jgi:replicative DNA helicase